MTIDLAAVTAIHVHVHIVDSAGHTLLDEELLAASAAYFETVREAAHAGVLIPSASVDPADGAGAVARLRDLAAAGAPGLTLRPTLQALPKDTAAHPLYGAAAGRGLVLEDNAALLGLTS